MVSSQREICSLLEDDVWPTDKRGKEPGMREQKSCPSQCQKYWANRGVYFIYSFPHCTLHSLCWIFISSSVNLSIYSILSTLKPFNFSCLFVAIVSGKLGYSLNMKYYLNNKQTKQTLEYNWNSKGV